MLVSYNRQSGILKFDVQSIPDETIYSETLSFKKALLQEVT